MANAYSEMQKTLLDKIRIMVNEKDNKIKELENKIKEINEEKNKDNNIIEEKNKKLMKDIESLNKEIKKLNKNNEELQKTIKDKDNIISKYNIELKELEDKLQKISNKDIIKYADNYSHEIWRKLMDNFENIKDYHIGCNDVSDIVLNAIIDAYNWLEKQGEQKETLCDKCRKEQPSHSCQDITSLGRCALEKQGERIKLLLNKKGENVQDLIEKYVSDHADCRWLDASELEQLLNDFVLEYDIIKNREYEQQCKVSNDGNNR